MESTPEPALKMDIRLELSSSQLLEIFEVEKTLVGVKRDLKDEQPVRTWLQARFHEVPPRVHNTLAHNNDIFL